MQIIKLAHGQLACILYLECEELEEANMHTKVVDVALKLASPQESNTNSSLIWDAEQLHPLLSAMNIAPPHLADLEDLYFAKMNEQMRNY